MYKHQFFKLFSIFIFLILLNSCGIYKYTDQRNEPTTGLEKARKNVEQGRGVSLKGLVGNRGTNFEFSSSNPLWRASLEVLDFLPLNNVDYSGGVIISDWYSDKNDREMSIKISVRFLSNEIRSDSLKILVHQKTCLNINNCDVVLLNSKISEELTKSILIKATEFEKEKIEKK